MASAFAALEPVPAYLFPYLTAGFLSMGLATSGDFFMYVTIHIHMFIHTYGVGKCTVNEDECCNARTDECA